ncbi:DNA alkylation repair protein [Saccharibacillus alkalitolerans]|uniref:DNA alkylation repair protein n=1 Tax=Saccharibacillus alkalitolerans TaxID=2705290 RepID=A0ABX0F0Z6_9BACL|nr:DNA alkylation repair protein [Saccharibacillus alkalitolerans]NGZ74192.1 hypothetical protein [Saccharibacillus alkalitolerans]
MAEPLKSIYTKAFLRDFSTLIQSVYPSFEADAFMSGVLGDGWEQLELKARIRRISTTLGHGLPRSFGEALEILYRVDERCVGFPYLFFPDFVEIHGSAEDDFETALDALERFTAKSSSEFAIRPFLLRHPERTMARMRRWALSENEHVRRLASEGSRPRLPWGQSLPMFKADPAPVLDLLEALRSDPSLYVRKSVANNLNDISKDHPEAVKRTALRWYGTDPLADWIVRRGCRGLLRAADPDVLTLFGYASPGADGAEPLLEDAALRAWPRAVPIGGEARLDFEVSARPGVQVRLRLEYAIDFVKASGRVSRKLFLLADRMLEGGERLTGSRRHRFAQLTTRRHYPGVHRIALLVNGAEYAEDALLIEEPETGGNADGSEDARASLY